MAAVAATGSAAASTALVVVMRMVDLLRVLHGRNRAGRGGNPAFHEIGSRATAGSGRANSVTYSYRPNGHRSIVRSEVKPQVGCGFWNAGTGPARRGRNARRVGPENSGNQDVS